MATRNKSNGPDLSTFRRQSSSTSFASSSFSSCNYSSTFGRHNTHNHSNDGHVRRSSPSVRFSIDNRPTSPNRSISFTRQIKQNGNATQKRTCACSPTTHPGSYRCALHKRTKNQETTPSQSYHSSSRLNYRRSAMTNSLVRIGGVEGELVKRALTALIRPSSHHQRRRTAFAPRPSRLSNMSTMICE